MGYFLVNIGGFVCVVRAKLRSEVESAARRRAQATGQRMVTVRLATQNEVVDFQTYSALHDVSALGPSTFDPNPEN